MARTVAGISLLVVATILSAGGLRPEGAGAHGDITVLECDPGADSADGVSLGIIFDVDQPFVSIEMLFAARKDAEGVYEFTAELIRADTFSGPLETSARFSVDLPPRPGTEPTFARAHIELGYVPVVGTESFALRFVDQDPPNRHPLYGIANGDHCPDVHMKNEQTGDELTDRGNTPYMLVLGTNAPLNSWGDADCSGGVSDLDALAVFVEAAPVQPLGAQPPCIGLGDTATVNESFETAWGDFDCSGGSPDPADAVLILRFLARVPAGPITDCPAVPQPVLLTVP